MNKGIYAVSMAIVLVVVLLSVYVAQVGIYKTIKADGEATRAALTSTEGVGQFQAGAYWGTQAVNYYMSQKKNPSIQEVILLATQLRAEAVVKQAQAKRKPEDTKEISKKKKFLGIF